MGGSEDSDLVNRAFWLVGIRIPNFTTGAGSGRRGDTDRNRGGSLGKRTSGNWWMMISRYKFLLYGHALQDLS